MADVFGGTFDDSVRDNGLPVGSTSVLVSNKAEFDAAIKEFSAGDGGTIIVASDAEPLDVFVRDAGSDTGKILITSEDPDQPSQMVTARVLDSHDIIFDNLYFNSVGFTRTEYLNDAYVVDSKDIAFTNNIFESEENGPLLTKDPGENTAFFQRVDGLLFEDNVVSGYVHGVRIFDSNDVLVTGNEITEMQGDALHGGGWQDVKISNNYIHDLYGSTQEISHSDMIQLWGGFGLQATDGVLIEDNILDSADGAAYQSIFIRNTTDGITHQNIHVEDNLIYNGHPNGIRISGAEDTVVDGNTLLWNQQSIQLVSNATTFDGQPQISVNDPTGLVINNIAGKITGLNGTVVGDNGVISYLNPTDPNYYSNHFASVDGGGARTLEELQLRPDSEFVGRYGSAFSQPTDTAAELTPIVNQMQIEGERGSIVLDASLTRDDTGYLDETEATYTWLFADGVSVEGISVMRDFPTGDQMDFTLTVTRPDGTSASVDRMAVFERNDIADVDFNAGLVDDADRYTYYKSDASDFETSGGNKIFHMDGSNGLHFAKQDSAWGGLESFSMEFDISKDSADGEGRILNLQKAMKMYVDDDGKIFFQLTTDEGMFTASSKTGALSDTDWHNINVTYDGDKGTLGILVDDQLSGEVAASGTTPGQSAWGLQLGAHQHGASIAARIDNFNVVGNPDLTASSTAKVDIIPETPPAPEPEVVEDTPPAPPAPVEETPAEPPKAAEEAPAPEAPAVVEKTPPPAPVEKAGDAPAEQPKPVKEAPAPKKTMEELFPELKAAIQVTPKAQSKTAEDAEPSKPKVIKDTPPKKTQSVEEPAQDRAQDGAEEPVVEEAPEEKSGIAKLLQSFLSIFGLGDDAPSPDPEPQSVKTAQEETSTGTSKPAATFKIEDLFIESDLATQAAEQVILEEGEAAEKYLHEVDV